MAASPKNDPTKDYALKVFLASDLFSCIKSPRPICDLFNFQIRSTDISWTATLHTWAPFDACWVYVPETIHPSKVFWIDGCSDPNFIWPTLRSSKKDSAPISKSILRACKIEGPPTQCLLEYSNAQNWPYDRADMLKSILKPKNRLRNYENLLENESTCALWVVLSSHSFQQWRYLEAILLWLTVDAVLNPWPYNWFANQNLKGLVPTEIVQIYSVHLLRQ